MRTAAIIHFISGEKFETSETFEEINSALDELDYTIEVTSPDRYRKLVFISTITYIEEIYK